MPERQMCQKCGRILPVSKLERMKSGTYRQVCNQCKWIYYVKPSRERRALRELESRRPSGRTLPKCIRWIPPRKENPTNSTNSR